ncbi:MAG: hypothetical protein AAB225_31830, partial [Acidobacteriota bacterium]
VPIDADRAIVIGLSVANKSNVNGARGRSSEVLLDGVSVLHRNGDGAAVMPMLDSVEEVKVETHNLAAEFGNLGGGAVQAAVRSGTNEFHGSASWAHRNDNLNARAFNELRKGEQKQNVYHGNVGGPIRKNRSFFFFSLEGFEDQRLVPQVATVPTAAQAGGVFSDARDSRGNLIPIYDPRSTRTDPATNRVLRDQFAGNVVPASRIHAVAKRLLEFYPKPNLPADSNNLAVGGAQASPGKQFHVKADQQIAQNNRLFVRYSHAEVARFLAAAFPVDNPANVEPVTDMPVRSIALGDTHYFSPGLVHDFRLGFTRLFRKDGPRPEVFAANWADKLGIKGAGPEVFPRVGISGYLSLGQGSFGHTASNNYQLTDTLTWIRGSHRIKGGLNLIRVQNNSNGKSSPSGSYSFSSLFTNLPGVSGTGHALASFMLGQGSASIGDNIGTFGQRWWNTGLFLQDDIRLAPSLAVNLGFRLQIQGPDREVFNRQTNFSTTAVHPVAGLPGAMFVASQKEPTFFSSYYGVEPRLGLAWTFTRRTVLRAGYGVFTMPWSTPFGGRSTGIGVSRSFPSPDNVQPGFTFDDTFPRLVIPDIRQATQINVSAVNPDLRSGYMQHWNLGVQIESGKDLMTEISYVGSKGTNLRLFRDINQLPPELLGPPAQFGGRSFQQRRPFPHLLGVSRLDSVADSNYHSLQVRVDRRFAGGLAVTGAYTFGKSIDTASSPDPNGTVQNIYNLRLERAVSGFDVRHRAVANFVYDLPFGSGRGRPVGPLALDKILGGWQLSGFWVGETGRPLTIGVASNLAASFGGQRANIFSPNGMLPEAQRYQPVPSGIGVLYLDPAAFAHPGEYKLGNAPRLSDQLRGPGVANFDLGLIKNIPVAERLSIQFRSEFYNL